MLGVATVSVGTLTASLVHPREVMKSLILANAAAFLLAHNHPSGDPTPSAEDLAITKRIRECADLFGMRLLDHVILGHGRYCSMCDENLL
jgi:DNA repair protein RadC